MIKQLKRIEKMKTEEEIKIKCKIMHYDRMTVEQLQREIKGLVEVCQSCIIFDDYKRLVEFAAEIGLVDKVLTQKQQAV